MNYSFISKYKSKDFLPPNSNNLYNEYDSMKKPFQDPKSNYYWENKETNNNWATDNSIQKTLLKSVYTPTPLGEIFFNPENIARVQRRIKYEIYTRTNGTYVLEIDQNETDLLVVMRDVYITCSTFSPYKLVHQVKLLNDAVCKKIIPDMISIMKQDQEYINQLDKPRDILPLPVNVSKAGRLSLPSVTTLFFPK